MSRSLVDGDDELLGWGGLAAGGIEIQDVTGNHLDMLSEPNVRLLAEKLRTCLDRVQGAHKWTSILTPSLKHAPYASLRV